MRRRLILTVAATTSLVLVALLVSVGYALQKVAEDNAIAEASVEAQRLETIVGTAQSPTTLVPDLRRFNEELAGVRTSVIFADGTGVGLDATASLPVRYARARAAAVLVDTDEGVELAIPVFGRPEGDAVIRMIIPQERLHAGLDRSFLVLGLLGAALLGLALFVADQLARAFVRPVTALAATAQRLETGDLGARVDPDGPPEIREVGTALNRLAERIRELLNSEREAVADLAHRLRTPVTALRLDAESLTDPPERSRLGASVDELTRVVDDVIREARRPVREGMGARCDAVGVVRDRAAFWSALAEEESRPVDVDVPPGPLWVRTSEEDLAAALDALLGNVFAHTREGVPFTVRVLPCGGGCVVIVSDRGQGLPADETLIERGRSAHGSTGLGMDIARRTAEASAGRLVATTAVDGGAEVRLELGPATR